jgi:hypothetical protein
MFKYFFILIFCYQIQGYPVAQSDTSNLPLLPNKPNCNEIAGKTFSDNIFQSQAQNK